MRLIVEKCRIGSRLDADWPRYPVLQAWKKVRHHIMLSFFSFLFSTLLFSPHLTPSLSSLYFSPTPYSPPLISPRLSPLLSFPSSPLLSSPLTSPHLTSSPHPSAFLFYSHCDLVTYVTPKMTELSDHGKKQWSQTLPLMVMSLYTTEDGAARTMK